VTARKSRGFRFAGVVRSFFSLRALVSALVGIGKSSCLSGSGLGDTDAMCSSQGKSRIKGGISAQWQRHYFEATPETLLKTGEVYQKKRSF
jgi:hypothetical protein